MIIGITGNYASGKDSVAKILEKMNFFHISFSDSLREILKKNNLEITRENLINIGNDMRGKYGADILASLALEKVKDGENYVFTSIRNPEEVEKLLEREDFLLVNVIAPEEVRLKRILARNRENDPKTITELRNREIQENSTDQNAQQLRKVAMVAKVILTNDSSLAILEQKAKKLVADYIYLLQPKRPDWDNYFMSIAEQVKFRSNCMSAKKGSIIVKEKQIISSGYCGTPKGIRNCNEGGCPRCAERHLGKIRSGDYYSTPCACVHAEENAIIQAAYNGISTAGATLYTTYTPCHFCAKMIINAGIKEVVMRVAYPDDFGIRLLREAGIRLKKA